MVLLLVCATALAGENAIVLLPFDNFSGVQEAPGQVEMLMRDALKARGWTVADTAKVGEILEKDRIRYLDSLDGDVLGRIVTATGASAVVSGTVYAYSEGRNPIVAIAARIVRADGTLVWSDLAGLSGDDTEHLCGFGRKQLLISVAEEGVQRLTRGMPGPDLRGSPMRGPSKPMFGTRPASYRSRELEPSRQRVCVLPLDNLSTMPEAGRVVTDVVALRLASAKGFDVVDQATLRAAALNARIGSFRGIGSDQLRKLAAAVGTPLFVRGTVYSFLDPAGRPGAVPELQLELSLVDVREDRTLWVSQHARKGTDYIGFLMLGNVTNVVTLTDRVVSEMIDAEESAKPGRSDEKNAHAVRGSLAGVRRSRGEAERSAAGDRQR